MNIKKALEFKKLLRRPGVEPGSIAWEAMMITATLPTQISGFLTLISKSSIYTEYRNRVGASGYV